MNVSKGMGFKEKKPYVSLLFNSTLTSKIEITLSIIICIHIFILRYHEIVYQETERFFFYI